MNTEPDRRQKSIGKGPRVLMMVACATTLAVVAFAAASVVSLGQVR